MCLSTHVEVRTTVGVAFLFLLFLPHGFRDPTQAGRLGSRQLYLLRHLSGPTNFKNTLKSFNLKINLTTC